MSPLPRMESRRPNTGLHPFDDHLKDIYVDIDRKPLCQYRGTGIE